MIMIAWAMLAAPPEDPDRLQRARIDVAVAAIAKGQPQAAIDALDPAIARYEAMYKDEKRHVYCGMSMTETLLYLTMAAGAKDEQDKAGAVATMPGYCEALYLKGYSLIDLGRVDEAQVLYQRVIALAPMHAGYMTEMGQTYRLKKDWPAMLDWCTRSEGVAGLSEKDAVALEQGSALRCQGYALVELGRWDDAEAAYRKAVKLNAGDTRAIGELKYIAENRPKPKS